MNDLMSGGLHRLWKDDFVRSLGPLRLPTSGSDINGGGCSVDAFRVLDVAGGTGDVAFRVLDRLDPSLVLQINDKEGLSSSTAPVDDNENAYHGHAMDLVCENERTNEEGEGEGEGETGTEKKHEIRGGGERHVPQSVVTVCDINASMLKEGRRRADVKGIDPALLTWQLGSAECLPFPDNSFDIVTIAFGIRNVTDIPRALRDMHRVLRPGGRLSVLEFSHVSLPILKEAYDIYSMNVIPALGQVRKVV